jgi:hypothetical protein
MTGRAKTNSKIMAGNKGISALPEAKVFLARQDAHEIFNMTTREYGSQQELIKLVRHESLFELINLCIDLTLQTRPVANGLKSRKVAIVARGQKLQALHDWLDENIWRYKGQLDLCAMDASKIKGFGRSYAWTRKEITAYRALKKQIHR